MFKSKAMAICSVLTALVAVCLIPGAMSAPRRDVATFPKPVHVFAGSYSLQKKFLISYDAKADVNGKPERRMQVLTASPNLPKMGLSNCPIEAVVWTDDSVIATGHFVAKSVNYTMSLEYIATDGGKAQVTLIPEGKPAVTSVWIKADVSDFAPPKE